MLICLTILLFIVNLIGFIIVANDKYRARKRLWRIPEKVFFLISLFGGCPGVYVGMLLFRHKTRHWYFVIGIPVLFAVQVTMLYYLVLAR